MNGLSAIFIGRQVPLKHRKIVGIGFYGKDIGTRELV
jgi:hypothetical protein